MRNLTCLVWAAIALFTIQSCQNQGKNGGDSAKDRQNEVSFIKNSIEGGLTEIRASGLAITNSNNQEVIGLAKMMIDDHTKADSILMKIETDKKVEGKDTISAAHAQVIGDLSKKSGPAFDRTYMAMMVADHETASRLFANAIQMPDARISQFAKNTLPVIKMHLDSAKSVLAALK